MGLQAHEKAGMKTKGFSPGISSKSSQRRSRSNGAEGSAVVYPQKQNGAAKAAPKNSFPRSLIPIPCF
jgi:hypothetical protein